MWRSFGYQTPWVTSCTAGNWTVRLDCSSWGNRAEAPAIQSTKDSAGGNSVITVQTYFQYETLMGLHKFATWKSKGMELLLEHRKWDNQVQWPYDFLLIGHLTWACFPDYHHTRHFIVASSFHACIHSLWCELLLFDTMRNSHWQEARFRGQTLISQKLCGRDNYLTTLQS